MFIPISTRVGVCNFVVLVLLNADVLVAGFFFIRMEINEQCQGHSDINIDGKYN